jgi:hypothetical protein
MPLSFAPAPAPAYGLQPATGADLLFVFSADKVSFLPFIML